MDRVASVGENIRGETDIKIKDKNNNYLKLLEAEK